MPKATPTDGDSVLTLSKVYTTPYSAVVRDDVVMGVSRYFLERWVPLLGPDVAALINALRQLDFRCKGEVITLSGEALAREAAMSRRHLYDCLDAPALNAFVRVEAGERRQAPDGTIAQLPNRYHVRMDDPLSPADAEHLFSLLPRLGATPLDAARQALALDPRQLWAADPCAPALRFPHSRAWNAHDVIKRAFPRWRAADRPQQQELSRLAEALHRHVTLVREDGRASKVIVPQYFRRRWWPRLGHELAWAYLWLRGMVYDNPAEGQRRDTCWVDSLSTLLTLIGRPREWWRRNVEHARPSGEGWSLSDFFVQIDARKGRDPAHPQWVARQFRVALEIPIAPEDRAHYAQLLRTWPDQGIASSAVPVEPVPAGSATLVHTGDQGVCHTGAHRNEEGVPQTDTPAKKGSATLVHTGDQGVCHTGAQGSAILAHRNLESLNQAPKRKPQAPKRSSKHKAPPVQPAATPALTAAAADKPEAKDSDDLSGSAESSASRHLADYLSAAWQKRPDAPLCEVAPPEVWLRDAWATPVQPHSPAWHSVASQSLSPRDLLALMLAVWGDKSVEHPPRYLSWLVQRWQNAPDMPPVSHWERWQGLAQLPLRDWPSVGRSEWRKLATRTPDLLPFGLERLFSGSWAESPEDEPDEPPAPPPGVPAALPPTPPPDNGLDICPEGSFLTIGDIWHAVKGQLSLQLNPATYANWIEGAMAISYSEGILTVQASHSYARDQLARQFKEAIEKHASSLANQPITVRFIAKTPEISGRGGGLSQRDP